jgi:hypothetical protein
MPVGGSRHYQGAGLGQVGLWGCPSCGADNTGPLEQGCSSCGAGRPAPRPEPPTPPAPTPYQAGYDNGPAPRVSERTTDDPPYSYPTYSATDTHALVDRAYQAGYKAGYEAAMRDIQGRQQAAGQGTFLSQYKRQRTIVAALELFREQVLVGSTEEVASGEWCSVGEVTELIHELRAQYEVVHG